MQALCIELVPGNSAGVRGNHDDIRIGEIDELAQSDQRLVRAMEILEVACSESILDLA